MVWLALGAATLSLAQPADPGDPDIRLFLVAGAADGAMAQDARDQIGAQWRDGYTGIVWDLARSLRPPGPQLFRYFRPSLEAASAARSSARAPLSTLTRL